MLENVSIEQAAVAVSRTLKQQLNLVDFCPLSFQGESQLPEKVVLHGCEESLKDIQKRSSHYSFPELSSFDEADQLGQFF